MAERVFAVVAHPDDVEFVMAGTLLRLGQAGYELHTMNLADGCCGSTETDRAETARIRLAESRAAAAALGAELHEPLVHDLEIFYDRPTLARLTSVIREVAPRILLVHSPVDYMEDHTNACRLAVSAAFCRGMPNFPVEPPRDPVDRPVTIYHAQPHGNSTPLGATVRPDIFVDVSDLIDTKRELLAHHASQKEWLDASQGLDSYLDSMCELGREVGSMSGCYEYAEGWRKHLHLGYCDAEDNPLLDALGEWAFVEPATA